MKSLVCQRRLRALGAPRHLVGMGLLWDLEVTLLDGRDVVLTLPVPRPVLAWDHSVGGRRMWVVGGRYQVSLDGRLTRVPGQNPLRPATPREVARCEARQYVAKHWGLKPRQYVAWTVAVPAWACTLGRVSAVSYRTEKRGDGLSVYRHAFEGHRPLLGVSVDGRQLYWEARGYVVTDHGIEDA